MTPNENFLDRELREVTSEPIKSLCKKVGKTATAVYNPLSRFTIGVGKAIGESRNSILKYSLLTVLGIGIGGGFMKMFSESLNPDYNPNDVFKVNKKIIDESEYRVVHQKGGSLTRFVEVDGIFRKLDYIENKEICSVEENYELEKEKLYEKFDDMKGKARFR